MPRIIIPGTKINKESLTTKLTLIIVGLTAGSALLIPATYASFHPVTTGEIADNTIQSVDIGNGQVRTGDILDGQVYSVDIRDGQVGSVDVFDGTITSTDIGDGQVGSVDIGDGQVTAADIADDAINLNTQIVNSQFTLPGNFFGNRTIFCPAGTIVSGGGYLVGNNTDVEISSSFPLDPNGWRVVASSFSGGERSLTLYAVCLGPMP